MQSALDKSQSGVAQNKRTGSRSVWPEKKSTIMENRDAGGGVEESDLVHDTPYPRLDGELTS
jgi:hypothetical protein